MGARPAPHGAPRRPPRIRWEPPDDTPWVMTPPPGTSDPERAKARIVAGLTLACTVLSLYDLYLLAAGF